MVRRALLAAVAAWLAVVLVGASVVWAVISRTGQELVSGDALARAGSASSFSAPPPQTTSPSGPIKRRSTKPSDKPSGQGSASSSSPDDTATATPSTSPSPPSPTSGPGDTPSASQPPPTTPKRSATWRGKPGTVRVTCRGSAMSLDSLLTNAGWESERPEAHGGSLEVHFHRTSGDGEVELKAYCIGGTPRFEADEDDD